MVARYTKLYWHFFMMQIKVMMEYRLDFWIGMLSVIFEQGTSVMFVKFVFDHIQELHGWTFYEVLFIFGVASTGRSIHHIFFDNLWAFGSQYIRTGNFDRLLVRPINPLFHLIADRVHQDGFGQLLIGFIILGTAMPHLGIEWGWLQLLILAVMIISSGMIFVAVNLFFATFSFWMVDSLPIIFAVFNLSEFSKYPISIYNKGIRIILTWIIPYGFTAFYPAAFFIDHSGFYYVAIWTPVVAIVSCIIAYLFWLKGLRAFTSTGN